MTIEIEGVKLHLAHPDELAIQWVGQDELMRQLLAAWMVVNEQVVPMNPAAARKTRGREDDARLCGGEAHGA
jgi:hypothetical protein